MRIIKEKISLNEFISLGENLYVDMVKAVVDVESGIMAAGGELHADEEAALLDEGSNQQNLWGINIFLLRPRDQWIEFDSLMNIRPRNNNRSRGVENPEIRRKITQIVNSLID
jgi:hypothetical protein